MHRALILLSCFLWASVEGMPASEQKILLKDHPIEETFKPFHFAYKAEAKGGESTRHETADGSGKVIGSYGLSDEDGRHRVVHYIADKDGFRASIKTNEPGMKSEIHGDIAGISENIKLTPRHMLTGLHYASPYAHNLMFPAHYGHPFVHRLHY